MPLGKPQENDNGHGYIARKESYGFEKKAFGRISLVALACFVAVRELKINKKIFIYCVLKTGSI